GRLSRLVAAVARARRGARGRRGAARYLASRRAARTRDAANADGTSALSGDARHADRRAQVAAARIRHVTFDRYAQWLSRGRSHQAAGRAIDALLCYRHALRESPQGVEAQFHAGEIAWHMGNRAEAIAAWRRSSAASPRHLPSWHALADALAANGEFDASRDAVMHVLALSPDEPRAKKLRSLLDAATGVAGERSLERAVSRVSW